MYDHCTLDVSPPPLSQQKTLSQTCSLQQQLVIQIVVGGCSMICHCDSMPPRRTIIITIYCSRSFPQHYERVSPSVCTKEVNNDIILQESPCLYTITGVMYTTTQNTSNQKLSVSYAPTLPQSSQLYTGTSGMFILYSVILQIYVPQCMCEPSYRDGIFNTYRSFRGGCV